MSGPRIDFCFGSNDFFQGSNGRNNQIIMSCLANDWKVLRIVPSAANVERRTCLRRLLALVCSTAVFSPEAAALAECCAPAVIV